MFSYTFFVFLQRQVQKNQWKPVPDKSFSLEIFSFHGDLIWTIKFLVRMYLHPPHSFAPEEVIHCLTEEQLSFFELHMSRNTPFLPITQKHFVMKGFGIMTIRKGIDLVDRFLMETAPSIAGTNPEDIVNTGANEYFGQP